MLLGDVQGVLEQRDALLHTATSLQDQALGVECLAEHPVVLTGLGRVQGPFHPHGRLV